MELQAAVRLFLGEKENPATRRSYENALQSLMDFIGRTRPLATITKLEVVQYGQYIRAKTTLYDDHPTRPAIAKPLSPHTINKNIKELRHFFNWCVEMELIEESPATVLHSVRTKPGVDPGKAFTEEEIHRILSVAYGNLRNYALFRFLADTGCRAIGVSNLRLDDVKLEENSARVVEKGFATYTVHYSDGTANALRRWLLARNLEHDFVFGTSKGRLSSDAIRLLLRRHCQRAGIRVLGTHGFRHYKGFALAEKHIVASVSAGVLGHTVKTYLNSYAPSDPESIRRASLETHIEHLYEPQIIRLRRKEG